MRHISFFSHFRGALRDPGIDEGATLVINTSTGKSWFWYIPLPDDVVSVGVVGPIDYLVKGRGGDPAATFAEELALAPAVRARIADAEQLFPIRARTRLLLPRAADRRRRLGAGGRRLRLHRPDLLDRRPARA